MTPALRSSQADTRIRRLGRVLVIDDEPTHAHVLRRHLSDDNQVVVVSETHAALDRLVRGERYDVLLCELMMPSMDGIDLHRHLCSSHPDAADRMVFMTGKVTTVRIEAFFHRVSNVLL